MAPFKTKGQKATRYPGVKKLAEDRWLVRRTWIDDKTGQRKDREKIVVGTLDEALKARAELRERAPSGGRPSRPRFKDFADSWLTRRRSKVEASTYQRYEADVANLNLEFSGWWVDAITYDDLETWQPRMGASYAAATVNGWHRTLRLILDVAVRQKLLTTNPARELSTLPEGRTKGARGASLSSAQFKQFVEAIPKAVEKKKIKPELGRMVATLAWTGMRLGEVVALRWSDAVEGELHVERSVWRGQEKEDKTDDPRRVTIVNPLREVLEEQRWWLLTKQHPGLESGLVFPGNPQQAKAGAARRKQEAVSWYRSQSAVQRAVGEVCAVAKVPRLSPHALRRTFEDLLREAGVEQMVRRAVAGWRSDRAQGIYATVTREDRDAAADAMIKLVMG